SRNYEIANIALSNNNNALPCINSLRHAIIAVVVFSLFLSFELNLCVCNGKMYSVIQTVHRIYVNKWLSLIDLEESECVGSRSQIWNLDPTKKEDKFGTCLANMVVQHHQYVGFQHVYTFIKHPDYQSFIVFVLCG
ncbi:hypothetical protein RFI_39628, partial [Reticulomyxa filosa]